MTLESGRNFFSLPSQINRVETFSNSQQLKGALLLIFRAELTAAVSFGKTTVEFPVQKRL